MYGWDEMRLGTPLVGAEAMFRPMSDQIASSSPRRRVAEPVEVFAFFIPLFRVIACSVCFDGWRCSCSHEIYVVLRDGLVRRDWKSGPVGSRRTRFIVAWAFCSGRVVLFLFGT